MGKYLNIRQSIAVGLIVAFLVNTFEPLPLAQAQDLYLPAPGVMVPLSQPLQPPVLRGIKVHPENPFRFDFILDRGDSALSNDALKDESSKLIKYFLASLTIPEKDLWVNLSPYEKDRIIPNSFGLTEMGRDLLAEDYMLKQITASLIYPEDEIGKKFWKRVYDEAEKRYGTTNIPVNTFNKVWIVPEKAVVYENAKAGTAYVVEAKLKVMLEEDYLSLQKHNVILSRAKDLKIPSDSLAAPQNDINALGSKIVREIVIPELTKEVNENKNFVQLRQVYNSLILATWYKKKIRDSILEQVYADKNKVAGVNIDDPQEKERIYQRYLQAFKKGVYNYIKEEQDPITQETTPRKYFSGGVGLRWGIDGAMSVTDNRSLLQRTLNSLKPGELSDISAGIDPQPRYVRLTKDEEEGVLTKVREHALEGYKKYVQRFIRAVHDSKPSVSFYLSTDSFEQGYRESMEDYNIRHEGIVRDEKGVLWIIKKKFIDNGVERDLPRHERLAYLLSRGRANLTPIRFLNKNEFKELGYVEGNYEDYYLTRIVTQGNTPIELNTHDTGKIFAQILVENILTRKFDQHMFNIGYADDTPVSLDHDVIGLEQNTPLNEFGNDNFFSSFVYQAVLQSVMSFSLLDEGRENVFWKDLRIYDQMKAKTKLYLFKERFAHDMGLGKGWIGAEMLTKENITASINSFKQIRNFRELAREAGYEGAELDRITKFLTSTQQTLGHDMDFLWDLMTGTEGGFSPLDQAMVNDEKGRQEIWEEGSRLIAEIDAERRNFLEFVRKSTNYYGIYYIVSNQVDVLNKTFGKAKFRKKMEPDMYSEITLILANLKEPLNKYSDYGNLKVLSEWSVKFIENYENLTPPQQQGLVNYYQMALFIKEGGFTQDFADRVARIKKIYEKNKGRILEMVNSIKSADETIKSGVGDQAMNSDPYKKGLEDFRDLLEGLHQGNIPFNDLENPMKLIEKYGRNNSFVQLLYELKKSSEYYSNKHGFSDLGSIQFGYDMLDGHIPIQRPSVKEEIDSYLDCLGKIHGLAQLPIENIRIIVGARTKEFNEFFERQKGVTDFQTIQAIRDDIVNRGGELDRAKKIMGLEGRDTLTIGMVRQKLNQIDSDHFPYTQENIKKLAKYHNAADVLIQHLPKPSVKGPGDSAQLAAERRNFLKFSAMALVGAYLPDNSNAQVQNHIDIVGSPHAVPFVFNDHFMGNLDLFDERIKGAINSGKPTTGTKEGFQAYVNAYIKQILPEQDVKSQEKALSAIRNKLSNAGGTPRINFIGVEFSNEEVPKIRNDIQKIKTIFQKWGIDNLDSLIKRRYGPVFYLDYDQELSNDQVKLEGVDDITLRMEIAGLSGSFEKSYQLFLKDVPEGDQNLFKIDFENAYESIIANPDITIKEAIDVKLTKYKDVNPEHLKELVKSCIDYVKVGFVKRENYVVDHVKKLHGNVLIYFGFLHTEGLESKFLKIERSVQSIKFKSDSAMKSNQSLKSLKGNKTGGIDLTPANMNLQAKVDPRFRGNDNRILFHLDPAELARLQNAPGFVPVIINITPLKSLPEFLGLNQTADLISHK